MSRTVARVQLGLGLISIGRPWGFRQTAVPDEGEVMDLLHYAFDLGIRFFDTAPAYGSSERRLGKFLGRLTSAELAGVTVATKFGEYWSDASQDTLLGHSFEELARSVDRSLELLPKIDLLQLHKTTLDILLSSDLDRAWQYAEAAGVRVHGASISDPISARFVCNSGIYSAIQLPFNRKNPTFYDLVGLAAERRLTVITNRPFDSGALLYEREVSSDPFAARVEAYKWVLAMGLGGIVLTGTRSKEHLRQNYEAFQAALAEVAADSDVCQ